MQYQHNLNNEIPLYRMTSLQPNIYIKMYRHCGRWKILLVQQGQPAGDDISFHKMQVQT